MGLLDIFNDPFGNSQAQNQAGMPQGYNQALWTARLASLGAGLSNAAATGQGAAVGLGQAAQDWTKIPHRLQKQYTTQQASQLKLKEATADAEFRKALAAAKTPEDRQALLMRNPRYAARMAAMNKQYELMTERDKARHKMSMAAISANRAPREVPRDPNLVRLDRMFAALQIPPAEYERLKRGYLNKTYLRGKPSAANTMGKAINPTRVWSEAYKDARTNMGLTGKAATDYADAALKAYRERFASGGDAGSAPGGTTGAPSGVPRSATGPDGSKAYTFDNGQTWYDGDGKRIQ